LPDSSGPLSNPDGIYNDAYAQLISQSTNSEGKPHIYIEQMPGFNGSLNEYLARNVRYPEKARESNIQGRVIVDFTVDEDGRTTDIRVVRGIGGGCDEEAMRVVANMPRWKPGTNNGKKVKVKFTLPLLFQ
jgi:protein TonB